MSDNIVTYVNLSKKFRLHSSADERPFLMRQMNLLWRQMDKNERDDLCRRLTRSY